MQFGLRFNHPYRMLIICGSGSRTMNTLPSLIKLKDDNNYDVIDKIHLYVKDPNKPKYQYLT